MFDGILAALGWVTNNLAGALLWTGIAVALLAAVVVAPDAPRLMLRRIFRRRQPVVITAGTANLRWGTAPARIQVDNWNPASSVDDRLEALRADLIQLRGLVNTVENDLRAKIERMIEDVTARLALLESSHSALKSQVKQSEERANELDTRGFLPIVFGILVSGAPDELAQNAAIGWVALTFALIAGCYCLIILVKEYIIGSPSGPVAPATSS